MVKNTLNNIGDVGLIPNQGTMIPHAMGQWSPCIETPEPAHSGASEP